MSFKTLKNQAKNAFKLNKTTAILIILIEVAVYSVLSPTFIGLILIQPLNIGIAYAFMMMARNQKGDLSHLLKSLQSDYLNHLIQLALKTVYLILWSFLLVIPAIIKYFSYFLVEYILADNPSESDAITLSRQMMKGHKFELFMLQLSFIGWFILSALTFGILYVLYVGPYYRQTMAEYYLALKNNTK
jgi:uncharacterized membrane protein